MALQQRYLLGIKPKEAKYEDEFVEDMKDTSSKGEAFNGYSKDSVFG
jgi:hypothetical protein